MKIYYNQPERMVQQLANAKRICIDVETDTIPPAHLDLTLEYGLSYLTDILYLAICDVDTFQEVYVFKMPRMPESLKWSEYVMSDDYKSHDTLMRNVDAVRRVLSQPDIIIVGQNAVFDMRLVGGHYKIDFDKQNRVWDIRVVSQRFLLSNGKSGSLENLIDFWGWVNFFTKDDKSFYTKMKELYRRDVGQLLYDLDHQDLINDPVFKQYSTLRNDSVVSPAEAIFSHYVALDVLHTSRIARLQRDAFRNLVKSDLVLHGGIHRIPRWPHIVELLQLEGRIAFESCLQSIRGMRLDVDYAKQRLAFHQQKIKEHTEAALSVSDQTHLLPNWYEQFCALLFYTNVLETLTTNATFSDYRKFPNFVWKGDQLFQSLETIETAVETNLETVETTVETNVETIETGVETIETVVETNLETIETEAETVETAVETNLETVETEVETIETEAETVETAVETSLETIETEVETVETTVETNVETSFYTVSDWIKSLLIPHVDLQDMPADVVDSYLTTWANWLSSLDLSVTRSKIVKTCPSLPIPSIISLTDWVSRTSAFKQKDHHDYLVSLKTDWYRRFATDRQDRDNLLNSTAFKPFYLFVICGLDLPTNNDIANNWALVTNRVLEQFQQFEKAKSDSLSNVDYYVKKALQYVDVDENVIDYESLPTDFDWLSCAIRLNGFATGKKALDYYFSRFTDDDLTNHPIYHYAQALQHEAWFRRTREFLEHALRDGRVHSLLARSTTTGRFASTHPNLQNIDMKHFRGYFIPDDENYVFVELDYANAENKMGALVSRDNAFARATEGGDFHSAQAAVYWPDLVAKYRAEGDVKKLKELRTRGKAITFGSAYGAGINKLAYMIKTDRDAVATIIANMEKTYPKLFAAKRDAADASVALVRKGYRPSFAILWDSARVILAPYDAKNIASYDEQVQRASYRTWNYLQQGGVAQIVSRAMVRINNYLVDNGYKTRIAINIHDSIVLHAHVEEVDEILPKICDIMATIVPETLTEETEPFIHFVAEVGPENAFKWGWQHNRNYPLSLEHFYNRWGKHLLPESELAKPPESREAPTWVVNVAQGETIDSEVMRKRVQKQLEEYGIVVYDNSQWLRLQRRYERLVELSKGSDISLDELHRYYVDRMLTVKQDDGSEKTYGPFDFANYQMFCTALIARGYDKSLLTDYVEYDTMDQMLREYEEKLGVVVCD